MKNDVEIKPSFYFVTIVESFQALLEFSSLYFQRQLEIKKIDSQHYKVCLLFFVYIRHLIATE